MAKFTDRKNAIISLNWLKKEESRRQRCFEPQNREWGVYNNIKVLLELLDDLPDEYYNAIREKKNEKQVALILFKTAWKRLSELGILEEIKKTRDL